MKKIGIFLGFAPGQSIYQHGIGRLLTFIIDAINNDNHIIIACPLWYKDEAEKLIDKNRLASGKISFLTTNSLPSWLKFFNWISAVRLPKNKKKLIKRSKIKKVTSKLSALIIKFKKLANKISKVIKSLFLYILSQSSMVLFGLFFLPLLLLAIMVSPLIFILIAFVAIGKIAHSLMPKDFFHRAKRKLNRVIFKRSASIKVSWQGIKIFKTNFALNFVYYVLRKQEFKKLINKINENRDVSSWLIPTIFWPECKDINNKKVVAVPDLVFLEFPPFFKGKYWEYIATRSRESINFADEIICYSDYVKKNHILPIFSNVDKIHVIRHGYTDSSNSLSEIKVHTPELLNEIALKKIHNFRDACLSDHDYLATFDFTGLQYIFYPSQYRPYKNIFSLIRAYEFALRKKYVNIKLILTADVSQDAEISKYIMANRLQYDVLFLPNLKKDVLAAFNACAICSINPSLFEGGFPFTFSEAYSVGTPSIMSKIPVVQEEISCPGLASKMLFDPYNILEIVNKIEWAVLNSGELYELQNSLYEKLSGRSWEKVASQYVDILLSEK